MQKIFIWSFCPLFHLLQYPRLILKWTAPNIPSLNRSNFSFKNSSFWQGFSYIICLSRGSQSPGDLKIVSVYFPKQYFHFFPHSRNTFLITLNTINAFSFFQHTDTMIDCPASPVKKTRHISCYPLCLWENSDIKNEQIFSPRSQNLMTKDWHYEARVFFVCLFGLSQWLASCPI